jgi:hypothetical protein
MTISAAPPEACEPPTPLPGVNCSQSREQRGLPVAVVRMMGLETAAELLGKGRLADELCITVRALNYKMNADRGVSDADIAAAALALEDRAEKLLAHARKLRAVLMPPARRSGE